STRMDHIHRCFLPVRIRLMMSVVGRTGKFWKLILVLKWQQSTVPVASSASSYFTGSPAPRSTDVHHGQNLKPPSERPPPQPPTEPNSRLSPRRNTAQKLYSVITNQVPDAGTLVLTRKFAADPSPPARVWSVRNHDGRPCPIKSE